MIRLEDDAALVDRVHSLDERALAVVGGVGGDQESTVDANGNE